MPKLYKAPYYSEEEIEKLNEEDMMFPFSSKYMRYDSIKRQYIPTEELLIKHGIDLNGFLMSTGNDDSITIENELEFISDQIYSYIDKKSGSNIETLKWIIAKGVRLGITPFRFRLIFEEILWKQARFYVNNDDPTKSVGLDIEQKQYLNKGALFNEDRQIDSKLKTSLMDLGLTWVGSYDKQFARFLLKEDW